MAWKALFLGLLSKLFNLLSWPSFVLFLPLYASFWTMETQSHSNNQQCLTFWVVFALFAMLEHTFGELLLWLPFWPYVKGIVTFLLVMPYFGGASFVYKRFVRPYLVKDSDKFSLIWNIVFVLTRTCLALCGLFRHMNCFSSSGPDNFADEMDNTIVVNGQEETENNFVCQDKHWVVPCMHLSLSSMKVTSKPHYDNMERSRKPIILNKVQKEWSCALCLISTSSEKSFKEHLRGKRHKAKEEVRAEEFALKLQCNSSHMAKRKSTASLVGNLVNLETWSGLISPVVGSIRMCRWKKPEVGWVKLNTDGSIDQEKAGLGGLLRDHKGNPICAYVSKAHLQDIFLVELCAIWRGLLLARSIGIKIVWVESDSMSAVKTINKKQFHNGKADKCLKHIWSLLKKFDKHHVTHSWRETNRAADYLSKMVSKRNDVVLWPSDFPPTLHNIIKDDAEGRIYRRR